MYITPNMPLTNVVILSLREYDNMAEDLRRRTDEACELRAQVQRNAQKYLDIQSRLIAELLVLRLTVNFGSDASITCVDSSVKVTRNGITTSFTVVSYNDGIIINGISKEKVPCDQWPKLLSVIISAVIAKTSMPKKRRSTKKPS